MLREVTAIYDDTILKSKQFRHYRIPIVNINTINLIMSSPFSIFTFLFFGGGTGISESSCISMQQLFFLHLTRNCML